MNRENYKKYAEQYKRTLVCVNHKPKRGWAVWVENGQWITARKVKTGFGHAYDNGGYEQGIRDCPCGCYMLSSSSAGPVDPFGDCPHSIL